MIARVAPLRRFPRGQGIYDYTIPEDLTINVGSFILVPFKSQTIQAVVIEIIKTSPYKNLKAVKEIDDVPPLAEADVDFYISLAKYTYDSVGTIFNAAIPPKLKRKTKPKNESFEPLHVQARSDYIDSVKLALGHIQSKKLSTISTPSASFSYLISGVLAHRLDAPLLIICPSIATMNHVARIATAYSKSVSTYGGTMSKTHAFEIALAIRQGSRDVIVTTRVGSLIPPSSNTRIIMIESGDEDYHQTEQRPHYDARWCLKSRLETHGNPVTFLDVLPRVEESPITLDLWRIPTSLKLIPLSDPRERTKHWFITNTLLNTLRGADPDSLFIIYHNRLEFERLILCGDCGETTDKRQSTCNSCGSTKIKTKGLGIKKIHAALSELITDRPVTLVQSQDEIPKSGIMITTKTIFSRWPHQYKLSGVAVVLSEQIFAHHGFRSLERGRRTIRALTSNAQAQNAPCIIQCMDADMVNKSLAPTIVLVDEEMNSRKMFNYPPFGTLVDVKKINSKQSKQYKLEPNQQHPDLLTLPTDYDIIVN